MSYYYEKELKGERETALKIVKAIEEDFQRYITSSHKDAAKNGLRYALNMLATFYNIYRSSKESVHYDIFVDIYVRVIAPHLDANASPEHFKRILQSLRHLHLTLASLSNAETEKLYNCIVEQQTKWSGAEEFKYLLNIHGAQIRMLLQSPRAESHKFDKPITKLVELFRFASQRCQEYELNAFDFTNSFMESLKINTTAGCTLVSNNLSSSQKQTLFEAYFELLSAVSFKPLTEAITPEVAFQVQLKATRSLIKIDFSNNLEQQLALKQLQICRRISYVKQHQNIADWTQIFYNLVKLSYVQVIANNFKENYKRTCEYFCELLKRASKHLLKEVWFQDLLLLVYQLQNLMRPISSDVFNVFWAQMDDILFGTHFYFIKNLLVALPYTTKSEMFTQHGQLTLATLCIEIYSFMIRKHDFCNKEPFTQSMLAINGHFKNILKCVKFYMINNGAEQLEMQKFNRDLTNLMTVANNPSQASFFIELGQCMADMKSLLPAADWQLLLRRLYQLGAKTEDADTAAEFHCCYIADLIVSKGEHTVPLLIQSQIHFFYNGICSKLIKQGKCLVEIYKQSRNFLKPLLQKQHIRLLHWLEVQYVFNNYKKDTYAELFVNLALQSPSKYDFLLAVSSGSLHNHHAIKANVQNIYELLRNMKMNAVSDNSNFSRMQELSLAYAAFLLWLEQKEKRVTELKIKDFVEDNLSQLIKEKLLGNLNVQNELKMLEMALDALHAFKAFYERADIEPIPINEGGFIDWSSILGNLTNLATYFQISGYIDYAIETWLLHYGIAKTIDDTQSCVRGLTFFCEYYHFFDSENVTNLNVFDEITFMSSSLLNTLEKLPKMLQRHQNFTLICLGQIAYFYAAKGRMADSIIYLIQIRRIHAELKRGSQYDVVLFTADIVQFRILWEFSFNNDAGGQCNKYSLLAEVHAILKRLENFVYISSVDVTLFDMLIINAVTDFAEFIANRLTENSLSSLFPQCLKISVDYGAAILTAKILSKWANIYLQMESLQKAEIKFLLIESILGLRNPDEIAAALKQTEKSEAVKNQPSPIQQNLISETVRRVVVISPKTSQIDKKRCISSMAFDIKLNRFLDIQKNNETIQRQPATSCINTRENLLLWTRFVLGTLRARFNFLAKNNEELNHFYESCKKWLGKRQNSFHYKLFYAEILMCVANYANYLRSSQKFDEAVELLEMFLKQFENAVLAANIDPTWHLNLQQQLKDTILENLERKNRNLPRRKRLDSPIPTITKLPTTPLNKTTRYAQLPVTIYKNTAKTLKAFTIYSDRKPSRKAAEKHNLLSSSNTRKDLKFTETDEKQAIKKNNIIDLLSDSETEEEQLKLTKKAVATKFIFNEAIDLDEPSKSAKKETSKKTTNIFKSPEDQLAIEHGMENLTIKSKKPAKSKLEISPQPSTASETFNNEAAVFKTPLSSLAFSPAIKSKRVQKSNTNHLKSSKMGFATSSSGNSSDTCSPNSSEEQTTDVTAGVRRLRSRQIAVTDDSKPSRRRPR